MRYLFDHFSIQFGHGTFKDLTDELFVGLWQILHV